MSKPSLNKLINTGLMILWQVIHKGIKNEKIIDFSST